MGRAGTRNGYGALVVHLWRLSRPELWTVTVLPTVVGHVLASRELVPGLGLWVSLADAALTSGVSAGAVLGTLEAWLAVAWPLLLILVIMGPLLWAATLLINDVHDLPGDRLNPRKAASPLVRGLLSQERARAAAYGFALASLVTAVPLGAEIVALVATCLGLAWAYSVPPVRLKERPGADVLVNALGVGALSAMAGWAVAAPLAAFPFWLLWQGLLVGVAIYVPTTLVDHAADAASGTRTLATHLGPARAYRIGAVAWLAANVGALGLAWTDTVLTRSFFPVLAVFVPVLLAEYHVLIGRARDPVERVRGIVVTSATFLAVNLLFALLYTGLWTL